MKRGWLALCWVCPHCAAGSRSGAVTKNWQQQADQPRFANNSIKSKHIIDSLRYCEGTCFEWTFELFFFQPEIVSFLKPYQEWLLRPFRHQRDFLTEIEKDKSKMRLQNCDGRAQFCTLARFYRLEGEMEWSVDQYLFGAKNSAEAIWAIYSPKASPVVIHHQQFCSGFA